VFSNHYVALVQNFSASSSKKTTSTVLTAPLRVRIEPASGWDWGAGGFGFSYFIDRYPAALARFLQREKWEKKSSELEVEDGHHE